MWILYIEWLTSHGAIECSAVLCQHVTIMHCTMHDLSSILYKWITLSGLCTVHCTHEIRTQNIYVVQFKELQMIFFVGGQNRPPEDWNINFCTYIYEIKTPKKPKSVYSKILMVRCKKQKFYNFDFLGPQGAKRGPQTEIFQLIWNQGTKISIQ